LVNFYQILSYLQSGKIPAPPTIEEKISTVINHMDMLTVLKGEHTGILEMRKHTAWYIKGIKNATSIKEKIFKTNSKSEFINILNSIS